MNKVCGDSYIHYAASVLSEYVELTYHVHTCITTSFTSRMCQCEPCAYTTMHNNKVHVLEGSIVHVYTVYNFM